MEADLTESSSNLEENKTNNEQLELKTFFINILQQISEKKLKKNVKGIYGSNENSVNLIKSYRKNDSDFFKKMFLSHSQKYKYPIKF